MKIEKNTNKEKYKYTNTNVLPSIDTPPSYKRSTWKPIDRISMKLWMDFFPKL